MHASAIVAFGLVKTLTSDLDLENLRTSSATPIRMTNNICQSFDEIPHPLRTHRDVAAFEIGVTDNGQMHGRPDRIKLPKTYCLPCGFFHGGGKTSKQLYYILQCACFCTGTGMSNASTSCC